MARIAFLQNFWFEFLGPMYISSVLKEAGHEVRLFIGSDPKSLVRQCADFKPQVAAFSVSSGSQAFAYRVGSAFQEAFGSFTIMGGPHPTFYPDAVKPKGIDAICKGEGEMAMRDLAEAIDHGLGNGAVAGIPNLWVKQGQEIVRNDVRPLIDDLDAIPPPDRSLYYSRYPFLRDNPNKHFITARGCPYDCTFCSNKGWNDMYAGKGAVLRHPSVSRVVDEIVDVRDRFGIRTVRFDDDVFTLDKRYIRELLSQYKEQVRLPFTCLVRADNTDEEIASLLASAGCHMVYFGIESGDAKLREEILKKGVSDEQIVEAGRLFHRQRIRIGTFNMLGIPGETLADAEKTVKLNQTIKTDYPWCSVLQPYPDTDVERFARDKGYLAPDVCPDDFGTSYFNRSIIANNQDGRALENLHKLFFLAVKVPSLWPIIRRLVRLPKNPLFDAVFRLTYGYRYIKTYRISVPRLLQTAWRLRRQF